MSNYKKELVKAENHAYFELMNVLIQSQNEILNITPSFDLSKIDRSNLKKESFSSSPSDYPTVVAQTMYLMADGVSNIVRGIPNGYTITSTWYLVSTGKAVLANMASFTACIPAMNQGKPYNGKQLAIPNLDINNNTTFKLAIIHYGLLSALTTGKANDLLGQLPSQHKEAFELSPNQLKNNLIEYINLYPADLIDDIKTILDNFPTYLPLFQGLKQELQNAYESRLKKIQSENEANLALIPAIENNAGNTDIDELETQRKNKIDATEISIAKATLRRIGLNKIIRKIIEKKLKLVFHDDLMAIDPKEGQLDVTVHIDELNFEKTIVQYGTLNNQNQVIKGELKLNELFSNKSSALKLLSKTQFNDLRQLLNENNCQILEDVSEHNYADFELDRIDVNKIKQILNDNEISKKLIESDLAHICERVKIQHNANSSLNQKDIVMSTLKLYINSRAIHIYRKLEPLLGKSSNSSKHSDEDYDISEPTIEYNKLSSSNYISECELAINQANLDLEEINKINKEISIISEENKKLKEQEEQLKTERLILNLIQEKFNTPYFNTQNKFKELTDTLKLIPHYPLSKLFEELDETNDAESITYLILSIIASKHKTRFQNRLNSDEEQIALKLAIQTYSSSNIDILKRKSTVLESTLTRDEAKIDERLNKIIESKINDKEVAISRNTEQLNTNQNNYDRLTNTAHRLNETILKEKIAILKDKIELHKAKTEAALVKIEWIKLIKKYNALLKDIEQKHKESISTCLSENYSPNLNDDIFSFINDATTLQDEKEKIISKLIRINTKISNIYPTETTSTTEEAVAFSSAKPMHLETDVDIKMNEKATKINNQIKLKINDLIVLDKLVNKSKLLAKVQGYQSIFNDILQEKITLNTQLKAWTIKSEEILSRKTSNANKEYDEHYKTLESITDRLKKLEGSHEENNKNLIQAWLEYDTFSNENTTKSTTDILPSNTSRRSDTAESHDAFCSMNSMQLIGIIKRKHERTLNEFNEFKNNFDKISDSLNRLNKKTKSLNDNFIQRKEKISQVLKATSEEASFGLFTLIHNVGSTAVGLAQGAAGTAIGMVSPEAAKKIDPQNQAGKFNPKLYQKLITTNPHKCLTLVTFCGVLTIACGVIDDLDAQPFAFFKDFLFNHEIKGDLKLSLLISCIVVSLLIVCSIGYILEKNLNIIKQNESKHSRNYNNLFANNNLNIDSNAVESRIIGDVASNGI